jgi:hypothetical protein
MVPDRRSKDGKAPALDRSASSTQQERRVFVSKLGEPAVSSLDDLSLRTHNIGASSSATTA